MNQDPTQAPARGGYADIDREEEGIKLTDFFSLCANKWRWFALSIFVFLVLGGVYVLSTPKVYTRSASVIITDNDKGSLSSINQIASEIGVFNSRPDVNNELYAFSSPELYATVIKQLGLNQTYTTRKLLRPVLLYGDSMVVNVDFIDLKETEYGGLTVKPLGKGQFELSKFVDQKRKKVKCDDIIANFGDTVSTPVGKVVVTPGVNYNPAFEKKINVVHMSLQGAIEYFETKMKVEIVDDDASVISLTMNDVSIQRADDFIDELIDAYNMRWMEDKNKLANLTSEFITDRLTVIEQELGNVDSDISDYKSEHMLPDVQAVSEIYMKRADENLRKEMEISTQISIADYLRNYVSDVIKKGGLIPANSGIDSKGVESQIEEYNKMQLERENLLASSSSSNPLVKDMDAQLSSMRTAILASLDNLMVSLRTQLATVQKSDKSTNQAIASSPSQAKYLLSVERQQKVKEALYLFLLQKREENELSRSFVDNNVRILNYATGKLEPTAPVTRNIIIICFVLGLILPGIVLFISETLNTKLRSREDLKQLNTPFAGEIPHNNIKHYNSLKERIRRFTTKFTGKTYRENSVPALVVKDHSQNLINEAFRMLRANLEFMTKGKNAKLIMVTSFNPGSGKSFVTLNLAAAMALKHKGGRVLAIDLDLRRATLSEVVGGTKGVANYLAGSVDDYHELIRETSCPGLDIMPVGTIPPNPTELLYSDRLKELLDAVKDEYEYVFIDCPPAEIVADSSIITKYSDMTLFVVRAGLLDKRALPTIDEFYDTQRYKNISIVLNGTYLNTSPYRRYGSYTSGSKDYYVKD
ncbi:MAG: polysaccharide biosynthesis tyrosine autokinase [Lachnoclostridium sp.]|nr:polysaccharide biosynthesis tyrosine autokinase [Lachnoclostridium sp.]